MAEKPFEFSKYYKQATMYNVYDMYNGLHATFGI